MNPYVLLAALNFCSIQIFLFFFSERLEAFRQKDFAMYICSGLFFFTTGIVLGLSI